MNCFTPEVSSSSRAQNVEAERPGAMSSILWRCGCGGEEGAHSGAGSKPCQISGTAYARAVNAEPGNRCPDCVLQRSGANSPNPDVSLAGCEKPDYRNLPVAGRRAAAISRSPRSR
jgi:hypothetical protein